MTNPTLERAARAAETAYEIGGVDFEAIARAVLMAVREPDSSALDAGYVVRSTADKWFAMIDAILNEEAK